MFAEDNASGFVNPDLVEHRIDDDSAEFIMREEQNVQSFNRVVKACRAGRWYMLKALRPEYQSPVFERLLRKEYEITSSLSHPGIVGGVSLEEVNGLGLCVVEEYIQGQTLAQFIAHRDQMPVDEYRVHAIRIAHEIAEAMRYMHSKQVVHRDLKPDNILITDNGKNAKIIDFGFSDSDIYAILKESAGTARYMAPEQKEGAELKTDVRSDIYSFGVILRELFSDPRMLTLKRGITTGYARRYLKIADRCTRPLNKRIQHSAHLLFLLERAVRKRYWWQTPWVNIPVVLLAVLALGYFLLRLFEPVVMVEGTQIPMAEADSVVVGYTASERDAFLSALSQFEADRPTILATELEQTMLERARFVSEFTPDSLARMTRSDFDLENTDGFCFRLRNEMRLLGDMTAFSPAVCHDEKMTDADFDVLRASIVRSLGMGYTHTYNTRREQLQMGPLRQRLYAVYFPERYLPIIGEFDAQMIFEQLVPDAGQRAKFTVHRSGDANAALVQVHNYYALFRRWSLTEFGCFVQYYYPNHTE